ncbi:TetR/AcrR family transcriptional regulator [Streptomyces sp. NPDC058067]|uniref:TetR/AcrR family transcriptional regulator n=1 Tax=Streptomyces sp. NPDC058067 TaxID=3346324 RepID=UPI0036E1BE8F
MVKAGDGAERGERPGRTSVWLEGKAPRTRRSDQPSTLDRERITVATVKLLDAEGLAKFSMRRLAAELGVTAMSVYWYVDTKDDLLELALDHVFGELDLPEPEASEGDWRTQLRQLAGMYRANLVRHPWTSTLTGHFLNIGPHSLAFSRRVQRILADTGLTVPGQRGAIAAVFQFVYGYGTIEGHFVQRCADAGMTQDEYYHHAMGAFSELAPEMADDYENARALMAGTEEHKVEEIREGDFQVALDLLVAGIDTMVAAQRTTSR